VDLDALLNPEQREAAITTEGPLLILAGAGSGKTRVLVHRIAHILDEGRARPFQIFAVTFTNKAAGEMRSRLESLLGDSLREAWIGTFHALSARMLRMEGHRLGYSPSYTIYDDDDSKRLIKAIMEELQIDSSRGTSVAQVGGEIDRAKNMGLLPEQYLKIERTTKDDVTDRAVRRVYPKYQDALRRSNAMDFGDLVMLAVELLRHHQEARQRFADRFWYVMVDEFQDTNKVQYELLKLLAHPRNNIAVVGDDDQAIYRWRGADVSHILGFEKEFEGAHVVKLERNYRSTGNILAAANAVIQRNKRRHEKTLRTSAPMGTPVGVGMVIRSEDESELVARIIEKGIERGERPEDYAILYRQNAQSRLFEESLRRHRVPFTLIGGTGFYERMEVKDVLAYLRITANPSSRQDFERIINTPARGIGDKTIALVRQAGEAASVEGALMLDLPERELLAVGLKKSAIDKLKALGNKLAGFRKKAETEAASEVARAIIEETDYKKHLERTEPQSADDRAANVEELVSSIAQHETEIEGSADAESLGIAGARSPLQAFLDSAALVSTNDLQTQEGAVSMLTLHSAKGLEFPFVFMVGMEELTFPSKRAMEADAESMEEERRLCYVGMTRAMKELYLVAARYRRIYGREEVRWPSRFLAELPEAIVGNVPTLERATLRQPSSPSVLRGGDEIVYDADPPPPEMEESRPHGPSARRSPASEPSAGVSFRRGSRVYHNTFGEGTVEDADGQGPAARLTIRFPKDGVKRVVARFVRSLEES
jgi:DNA helicase-2/ATP-dependent DNA helicase PcrA